MPPADGSQRPTRASPNSTVTVRLSSKAAQRPRIQAPLTQISTRLTVGQIASRRLRREPKFIGRALAGEEA